MDFTGIYSGIGVIVGAAIAKYTSSKSDKQLTKSEGENGSSTIRRILERIEEQGIQTGQRVLNVETDVRKLGGRVDVIEAKQDTAAALVVSAATAAATAASTVAAPSK